MRQQAYNHVLPATGLDRGRESCKGGWDRKRDCGSSGREICEQVQRGPESGDYGREFVDAFRANVISEETNVASATAKVALGEADAGITYYSDVTKDLADKITIIEIPDEFNIVATYVAGILTESTNKELAQEYINLLTSEEGKAVLEEYNFAPAN